MKSSLVHLTLNIKINMRNPYCCFLINGKTSLNNQIWRNFFSVSCHVIGIGNIFVIYLDPLLFLEGFLWRKIIFKRFLELLGQYWLNFLNLDFLLNTCWFQIWGILIENHINLVLSRVFNTSIWVLDTRLFWSFFEYSTTRNFKPSIEYFPKNLWNFPQF